MHQMTYWFLIFPAFVTILGTASADQLQSFGVNSQHVQSWNRFANSLYDYHKQLLNNKTTRRGSSQTGSYARRPAFYTATEYLDRQNGRVRSRVSRERKNPANIHIIELFFYDKQGRVKRDYTAAFLPKYRNAPVQTLISLHHYTNSLHGFRVFDASGTRIYEVCKGSLHGKTVSISMDMDDLAMAKDQADGILSSTAYKACFGSINKNVGKYKLPVSPKTTEDVIS